MNKIGGKLKVNHVRSILIPSSILHLNTINSTHIFILFPKENSNNNNKKKLPCVLYPLDFGKTYYFINKFVEIMYSNKLKTP